MKIVSMVKSKIAVAVVLGVTGLLVSFSASAACGPGGGCGPRPGSGYCWDAQGRYVVPCATNGSLSADESLSATNFEDQIRCVSCSGNTNHCDSPILEKAQAKCESLSYRSAMVTGSRV